MSQRIRRATTLLVCLALFCGPASAGKLDLYDELDAPSGHGVDSVLGFTRMASFVVMGTALLDTNLREDLLPWRNSSPSQSLRSFGDKAQIAGPVVGSLFLLHGLAFDSPKSRQTAFLAYQSFLVSGGLSAGIKLAFGRERPSSTEHNNKFMSDFSDPSFPSGHTTTAFAAATVFAEQYPHWYVAMPAYAAAAATGYSRLSANKHWMSDVAAGAMLGWGVGHFLRKRALRHEGDTEAFITPNGVRVQKKF